MPLLKLVPSSWSNKINEKKKNWKQQQHTLNKDNHNSSTTILSPPNTPPYSKQIEQHNSNTTPSPHHHQHHQQQQQHQHQHQYQHQYQDQQHSDSHPESPNPLPPELTIAVIHPTLTNPDTPNIQATIESRLAATGFKILDQQTLSFHTNPDATHTLARSSPGIQEALSPSHSNIVYLLSRSRAIQAWKDLVGVDSSSSSMQSMNEPLQQPRPGSLRFIFGPKSIWAADKVEVVYQFIHSFWPKHLHHPTFNQLLLSPNHQPNFLLPPHHLSVPPPSPIRTPKRVFKFSNCSPAIATDVVQSNNNNNNDNCPAQPTSHTTTPQHLKIIQDEPELVTVHSNQPEEAIADLDHIQQNQSHLKQFNTRIPTLSFPISHLSSNSSLTPTTQESSSTYQTNDTPNESHSSSSQSSLLHPPGKGPIDSNMPSNTHNNNRTISDDYPLPQSLSDPLHSSKAESLGTSKISDSYTFRARPIPASLTEPTSSPKMSKAAMLRLGLTWTPPVRTPAPASSQSSPANGAPPARGPIAPVASLNPPTVQPRPTKASTLRTNGGPLDSSSPVVSNQPARPRRTESEIFENTPGHGFRRANLQTNIASIAAPKTQPRPTKASALRTGGATPSAASPANTNGNHGSKTLGSAARRSVDFHGVPGHKRNEKIQVGATKRPEIEPRMTKASLLRMGGGGGGVSPLPGGSSSSQRKKAANVPLTRPTHATQASQTSAGSTQDGTEYHLSDADEHEELDDHLLDSHPATLPIDLCLQPSPLSCPAPPAPRGSQFGSAIIRQN
ncbi:hypothetical protein PCASD_09852 [Puccinia coronata f. sp. avenae]|uniref:Nucleoside diphosphate kinase n=1 Tax=Puccinia coronata f. sp. avenae TaxID=200324 RepID=A0A2N5UMK2_9BASI|nr:hypothetical protein PCASD_09852 [Puccinia coronata f. sp. avenae]